MVAGYMERGTRALFFPTFSQSLQIIHSVLHSVLVEDPKFIIKVAQAPVWQSKFFIILKNWNI